MTRRRPGTAWTVMVIAVSWCLPSAPARAQSVTTLAPLDFGIVIAGTTSSVDPRGVGAMEFELTGPIGLNGGTFTLPTQLSRVGGGATMPITFCATCGVYRIANNNPAGGVTFNPNNQVFGIGVLNLIKVYLWIGGSVSPIVSQTPGSYTGTVVFTIAPII